MLETAAGESLFFSRRSPPTSWFQQACSDLGNRLKEPQGGRAGGGALSGLALRAGDQP
jgi:hypothetical protein